MTQIEAILHPLIEKWRKESGVADSFASELEFLIPALNTSVKQAQSEAVLDENNKLQELLEKTRAELEKLKAENATLRELLRQVENLAILPVALRIEICALFANQKEKADG